MFLSKKVTHFFVIVIAKLAHFLYNHFAKGSVLNERVIFETKN